MQFWKLYLAKMALIIILYPFHNNSYSYNNNIIVLLLQSLYF